MRSLVSRTPGEVAFPALSLIPPPRLPRPISRRPSPGRATAGRNPPDAETEEGISATASATVGQVRARAAIPAPLSLPRRHRRLSPSWTPGDARARADRPHLLTRTPPEPQAARIPGRTVKRVSPRPAATVPSRGGAAGGRAPAPAPPPRTRRAKRCTTGAPRRRPRRPPSASHPAHGGALRGARRGGGTTAADIVRGGPPSPSRAPGAPAAAPDPHPDPDPKRAGDALFPRDETIFSAHASPPLRPPLSQIPAPAKTIPAPAGVRSAPAPNSKLPLPKPLDTAGAGQVPLDRSIQAVREQAQGSSTRIPVPNFSAVAAAQGTNSAAARGQNQVHAQAQGQAPGPGPGPGPVTGGAAPARHGDWNKAPVANKAGTYDGTYGDGYGFRGGASTDASLSGKMGDLSVGGQPAAAPKTGGVIMPQSDGGVAGGLGLRFGNSAPPAPPAISDSAVGSAARRRPPHRPARRRRGRGRVHRHGRGRVRQRAPTAPARGLSPRFLFRMTSSRMSVPPRRRARRRRGGGAPASLGVRRVRRPRRAERVQLHDAPASDARG